MSEDEQDSIDAGKRLVRVGGDHGLSLAERLAHHFHRLSWRSPLHALRLRGRFPLKLQAVPADPFAGDAEVGQALTRGQFAYRGRQAEWGGNFASFGAQPDISDWVQGFGWLRDLSAALPREHAARIAEPLLNAWLSEHAQFEEKSWRPDLWGRRLLFWTAYAPLILSSPNMVYRSAVLNGMARGARHLDRSAAKAADGLPRATAFAGLIVAGLLIPGGEIRQARAEAGLERALSGFLCADGGVASRVPTDLLDLLELMLLSRASYSARRKLPPDWFDGAIDRMVPALKGVTLGDGALSAWHGAGPAPAARIEKAVAASGIQARPLKNGRDWGYQRLAGGKTLVVMDAGPPPPGRLSLSGHASTLAFEMSDGPQRLVINCGGGQGLARGLDAELAGLLRATAAHSTLVVADVNSTTIRADGALGRGVFEVVEKRQENEAGAWLDASHDGYARRFGIVHQRRLFLSSDGNDVRGEDTLLPAPRKRVRPERFDVRFHLAPGIEAAPTADGQGALLKLPGKKAGWQFRCRGGTLHFDDSLWIDPEGRPRPTRQLVISGEASPGGSSVAWSFRRAG